METTSWTNSTLGRRLSLVLLSSIFPVSLCLYFALSLYAPLTNILGDPEVTANLYCDFRICIGKVK